MDIISLLQYTLNEVLETFSHNWFLLVLTITGWRVIGIVIGTLWLGSILIGFAYNLLVI